MPYIAGVVMDTSRSLILLPMSVSAEDDEDEWKQSGVNIVLSAMRLEFLWWFV